MNRKDNLPSLVADAYASSSSDRESAADEPGDAGKQEPRAAANDEPVKPGAASAKRGVEPARNPAANRNAAKSQQGEGRCSTETNPSDSLPPELVRELERERKKGGKSVGLVPEFIEVNASFSSAPTAQAAQTSEGERHRSRHLAAHSLRKAGVSKAARRNHHITELMAAARAQKIVEEARRLG